jgi:hypothetical protein
MVSHTSAFWCCFLPESSTLVRPILHESYTYLFLLFRQLLVSDGYEEILQLSVHIGFFPNKTIYADGIRIH